MDLSKLNQRQGARNQQRENAQMDAVLDVIEVLERQGIDPRSDDGKAKIEAALAALRGQAPVAPPASGVPALPGQPQPTAIPASGSGQNLPVPAQPNARLIPIVMADGTPTGRSINIDDPAEMQWAGQLGLTPDQAHGVYRMPAQGQPVNPTAVYSPGQAVPQTQGQFNLIDAAGQPLGPISQVEITQQLAAGRIRQLTSTTYQVVGVAPTRQRGGIFKWL